MKKKLIAVAVAGALAAPLAAQADVTIYGKMHISADWYMNSVSGELVTDDDDDDGIFDDEGDDGIGISSNSSRIGFKGSEDLGADLKAVWQVESTVNLDEAGDEFASRNSFLGLASGFGTVLFGRHDSPFKDVGRRLDIFGDTVGDTRALTGALGTYLGPYEDLVVSANSWDLRLDNVIAYISPDFAGLKVFAAYSAEADSNPDFRALPDNNDMDAWSASISYESGPFFAAVAYERHSYLEPDGVTFVDGTIVPVGDLEEESQEGIRLGGGVTFGSFRVGAMWQRAEDIFATADPTDPIDEENRDLYHVFAQYAFGATSIGVQWTMLEETDEEIAGEDAEDGAQLWSVGLFHNLSKRTQAYAMYSMMDNDDGGAFALAAGGGHGDAYLPFRDLNGTIDPTDDELDDPSAFSVGIIHSF